MRKAAPGVAKHETSLLHPAFARTAACDEEKSGTRRSASDDEITDGIAGIVFIHTDWCDLSSPKKKVKCWLRTVATRNTWRRRGGSKRQAAKAKCATGPTDGIDKRVELKERLHSRRKLKRRSTQHRRYSMPVANVEAGGGSTCVLHRMRRRRHADAGDVSS